MHHRAAALRALSLGLVLLALAAAPLAAQPAPRLHDVTGVAADDVLNIRAGPSARTAIIGALAPDATAVEVVATAADGRWGQVNTAERAGWVALRFMQAQPLVTGPHGLPRGVRCFGTEPFWSLRATAAGLRYTTPATQAAPRAMSVAQSHRWGDPGALRAMLRLAGPGGVAVLHVRPGNCSDGMSARAYGLRAALALDGGSRLRRGCCTLSP